MSCRAAISLKGVGKYYEIYEKPRHRLWQLLFGGRRSFYKKYWALADITLEIAKGECIGIVGRNGAGKSTLLQIIAGTLTPSTGEAQISGRLAALLELGSGFNPEFTGRENVRLNAAILGLTRKQIDERFQQIAEFAGIGDFMDRPVKTYSSGMTLRLAFAVMANVDADILVIDEALAVGDAFFTQKCLRFLRNFMLSHTVVFVSHDINSVCSLCTRAILLQDGRMRMDGDPRQVAQLYLEGLYGIDKEDRERRPDSPAPPGGEALDARLDMRAELIAHSNLRNDLEIFPFNGHGEEFGGGGGIIENVWFGNEAGESYAWLVGGEKALLRIRCRIKRELDSPIVGFLVRNSHGQEIFGDNTWLAYRDNPPLLHAGDVLEAAFEFRMPILAPGQYFITAALADGTPEKHVQEHWLHEAIAFTAHSSSISGGLVGVPMTRISLTAHAEDAPAA